MGLREARVPPRPQPGPGWRVGALGRRWPPGAWTIAGGMRPRGARARSAVAREGLRPARGVLALASVGKPRIPSGRALNLVPAVASHPRAPLPAAESERAFRLPAPVRQAAWAVSAAHNGSSAARGPGR